MTWDEEYKGMKKRAGEQVDDSPWPAVIVLLALMGLVAFFGWMAFGGGCG